MNVLLWLDVETTGLKPYEGDVILEVAAVVTDTTPQFNQLAGPFSYVCALPDDLRVTDVSPNVLSMHSLNGLWAACQDATASAKSRLEDLKRRLYLATNSWDVILAGRSVHFDRSFVDATHPGFFNDIPGLRFSHRHFDLSSIKMMADIAGIKYPDAISDHRALGDVLGDIKLAQDIAGLVAE